MNAKSTGCDNGNFPVICILNKDMRKMERNDYIHIFNKFLENKATPSEIKLLIEWLKERKAFDTWADDIWMQSPMKWILQ